MSPSDAVSALTQKFWDLQDSDLSNMIIEFCKSSSSPSDLLSKLTHAGADTNLSQASAFLLALCPPPPLPPLSTQTQPVPISASLTGLSLPGPSSLSVLEAPDDFFSDQLLFEHQQMRLAGVLPSESRIRRSEPTIHRHPVARAEDEEEVEVVPVSECVPAFLASSVAPPAPTPTPTPAAAPTPAPTAACGPRGWRLRGGMERERAKLPIYSMREELVDVIYRNGVTVLIGETGSGKSTNLPQFLWESGVFGKIGVTQPRRVAAVSVAERVAKEQGVRLGEEVGYSIRFEDCTDPKKTQIKYMTDGILLQEMSSNIWERYGVIMLDEVHERSVNTDILMALLKAAVKRSEGRLRLVVTSATLEAEKFATYFDNAPIFRIPGRTYPVTVRHSKVGVEDYVKAAMRRSVEVVKEIERGHVLVFLTGQEEIERCAEGLRKELNMMKVEVEVLYAALSGEQQQKVFRKVRDDVIKVIISTNVAEASITIDGVVACIDAGKAKVKKYDEKTGKESLVVEWISQASANQRSGRAGRTKPGICYRLYTETEFKNFSDQAVPELLRSDLSGVVLMLKSVGVHDILNFDFIERPNTLLLTDAMKRLFTLGALDQHHGHLTSIGRNLALFPLSPEMGKVLLASADLLCSQEVAVILAFLSEGGSVFVRPETSARNYELALARHREMYNLKFGDLITYLEIYIKFKKAGNSRQWCLDKFLNFKVLSRIDKISDQLISMLRRVSPPSISVPTSCHGDFARIAKAFCAGFFANAVVRAPGLSAISGSGCQLRLVRDNSEVFVHPSSVLIDRPPRYFLFTELVITTKEYVRNLCVIDPRWLPECAPSVFKTQKSQNNAGLGEKRKLTPIGVKKGDEDAWRLKKRLGY